MELCTVKARLFHPLSTSSSVTWQHVLKTHHAAHSQIRYARVMGQNITTHRLKPLAQQGLHCSPVVYKTQMGYLGFLTDFVHVLTFRMKSNVVTSRIITAVQLIVNWRTWMHLCPDLFTAVGCCLLYFYCFYYTVLLFSLFLYFFKVMFISCRTQATTANAHTHFHIILIGQRAKSVPLIRAIPLSWCPS